MRISKCLLSTLHSCHVLLVDPGDHLLQRWILDSNIGNGRRFEKMSDRALHGSDRHVDFQDPLVRGSTPESGSGDVDVLWQFLKLSAHDPGVDVTTAHLADRTIDHDTAVIDD